MPIAASYYMTTVCNAKCSFCDIWTGQAHTKPKLQDLETVRGVLGSLRAIGVKYIDFTGGEALLVRNLPQAMRMAKEMGFKTGLVSNGFLFPARHEELAGLVDSMSFSLDSADRDRHNASRKLACYDRVLESIELARGMGMAVNINFSVGNDRLEEIEPMVELAQRLGVVVHIMPIFGYFGNEALRGDYAHALRRQFGRPFVSVNLAAVKLVEDGGNHLEHPTCKGPAANIAVSPDGHYLLPCYHAAAKRVPIDLEDPKGQWKSPEMKKARDRAGRHKFCEGCTIWCYLTPSFFYNLDKYFMLQAYSYARSGVMTLRTVRRAKAAV